MSTRDADYVHVMFYLTLDASPSLFICTQHQSYESKRIYTNAAAFDCFRQCQIY